MCRVVLSSCFLRKIVGFTRITHFISLGLLLINLFSCTSNSSSTVKAIYGKDDRLDLYENGIASILLNASRSTALLMGKKDISSGTSGQSVLIGKTLQERISLCPKERFAQQPSRGYCSGFLVGADLFATAGHCFDEDHTCQDLAVVFGYGYQTLQTDPTKISSQDIYYCKKIIKQLGDGTDLGNDYAIFQLDRSVSNRLPLKIRREGLITKGTDVAVIGHPFGLPTKVAQNAKVRSSSKDFFDANLDAFMGNSGSAVFNYQTGIVEGILVNGEEDLDWHDEEQCATVKRCPDNGCMAENATPARTFMEYIP